MERYVLRSSYEAMPLGQSVVRSMQILPITTMSRKELLFFPCVFYLRLISPYARKTHQIDLFSFFAKASTPHSLEDFSFHNDTVLSGNLEAPPTLIASARYPNLSLSSLRRCPMSLPIQRTHISERIVQFQPQITCTALHIGPLILSYCACLFTVIM